MYSKGERNYQLLGIPAAGTEQEEEPCSSHHSLSTSGAGGTGQMSPAWLMSPWNGAEQPQLSPAIGHDCLQPCGSGGIHILGYNPNP